MSGDPYTAVLLERISELERLLYRWRFRYYHLKESRDAWRDKARAAGHVDSKVGRRAAPPSVGSRKESPAGLTHSALQLVSATNRQSERENGVD